MELQLKEKIEKLTRVASALGKVGLLVVENEKEFETKLINTRDILENAKYQACADYLEIINVLSTEDGQIFYAEMGERLDGSVMEIIAEFEAGIISLADGKNSSGLKTAKWNPTKTSFIVLMTRKQIENSYPRLFEYVNVTQSI